MATTISGTSGVTTPAVVDTGPLSVGPQGITFGDATVQTTAAVTGANGNVVLNVYTTPGTWTKPATVKTIKVTVIGGGGGGGGTSSGSGGAGGGGGGTSINVYPAPSLPGPQPYTVGTGGTGGAPAPTAAVGGTGNTSSFGVAPITVVSATGGAGGGITPNKGGTGGTASNGNLNISGSGGGVGAGGVGGGTYLAGFTPGATITQSPGLAGQSYGGGGGGSLVPGTGNATGGAGATGVVIVEEFY